MRRRKEKPPTDDSYHILYFRDTEDPSGLPSTMYMLAFKLPRLPRGAKDRQGLMLSKLMEVGGKKAFIASIAFGLYACNDVLSPETRNMSTVEYSPITHI